MAALWTRSGLRGKLMIRRGGESLPPPRVLGIAVHSLALQCRSAAINHHPPKPNLVDNTTNSRIRWSYHNPSSSS